MDSLKRPRDSEFFSIDDDDEDFLIAKAAEESIAPPPDVDEFLKNEEERARKSGPPDVDEFLKNEEERTPAKRQRTEIKSQESLDEEQVTESLFVRTNTSASERSLGAAQEFEMMALDNRVSRIPLEVDNEESPLSRALRQNMQKTGLNLAKSLRDAIAGPSKEAAAATTTSLPHVYSRPPPTGSFIASTCPLTGKTVYFPRSVRAAESMASKQTINRVKSKTNLLGRPFSKVLREAERVELERKRVDRSLQDDEHQRKRIRRAHKGKLKEGDHESADTNQLWVDKYRPNSFMSLLGDERVNREVLKWVKQWDYCVFGRLPPSESQRDKAMRNYKNSFGNSQGFSKYDENRPKDRLMRPEKKILLLAGPPGFGKTTLAHVVAKHAGYNIIEVNASDDRTGEVVKSKIKSALEMQAIINKSTSTEDGKTTVSMQQKPNLLIIDEIDGASSGGGSESFIKQLVQLATAEGKTSSTDGEVTRRGKSKKAQPLLRPIICICNDLYAPVLRPLRTVAQIVQFRKLPMLTIAKRLQQICEMEGLRTDLRTLSLLAEMTEGDVRSCLHTLQFISGKSSSFTKAMLDEGAFGRKDMGKSLFTVWEELFNAPNASKKTPAEKDALDKNDKYFTRLIQSVMDNGEFEKIMQGCFESYPKMRFHDTAGEKIVQMGEWLNFYDHIDHRVNNTHEYGLYGYLPLPIVNFHRFFAGSAAQEHRVEYPKTDYENFTAKKSNESLISAFLAGIHPARRRALHRDIITTELVPRLIRIISPDLRPVNKQLIKPAEQEVLSRMVNTMIEFGLTFLQDKNSDGQFFYKLEPPIEQIIDFKSSKGNFQMPNRYGVRQLIAQEIETELLRRREEAAGEQDGASLRTRTPVVKEEKVEEKIKAKMKNKVPTDFFGRPIQQTEKSTPKTTVQSVEIPKPKVTYRYHEGFSNAVRKPMNMRMFL